MCVPGLQCVRAHMFFSSGSGDMLLASEQEHKRAATDPCNLL